MNIKRILRPIYIPIVAKAKFLRLRLIQPLRIMSAEAIIARSPGMATGN